MKCYIIYSRDDPFCLPCAVLDTKADCARWLGVSVEHFCLNFRRCTSTNGYYCDEVLFEDEDDETI